jgi:hypothetical protein
MPTLWRTVEDLGTWSIDVGNALGADDARRSGSTDAKEVATVSSQGSEVRQGHGTVARDGNRDGVLLHGGGASTSAGLVDADNVSTGDAEVRGADGTEWQVVVESKVEHHVATVVDEALVDIVAAIEGRRELGSAARSSATVGRRDTQGSGAGLHVVAVREATGQRHREARHRWLSVDGDAVGVDAIGEQAGIDGVG